MAQLKAALMRQGPALPKGFEGKRKGGFSAPGIGRSLGSALGNLVLPGVGGLAGGLLGQGLGYGFRKITGYGDYTVSKNSLMRPSSVPAFGTSGSITIRHKEYLGDVFSTTGFNLTSYPINPGMAQTFPWLSTMASCFEEFDLHGCIFQFVSTSSNALNSTNTSLGKVVMATQYNSVLPDFKSTTDMMVTQFSNYGKPAEELMHAIECAPFHNPTEILYVRTGPPPPNADLRLFDLGRFQIATEGMQSAGANIGGLWVSYDVTFNKPILSNSVAATDMINSPEIDIKDGAIFALEEDQIRINYTTAIGGRLLPDGTYSFPTGVTPGDYFVNALWYSGVSPGAYPNATLSNLKNLALKKTFRASADAAYSTSGASVGTYSFGFVVTVLSQSGTTSFQISNTLPAAAESSDFMVTRLSTTV